MYAINYKCTLFLINFATTLVLSLPLKANAPFSPNCTDAAPGAVIKDPEFDQVGYYATWQDDPIVKNNKVTNQGTVKVANIDPTTGNFILSSIQNVVGSNPYLSTVTKNGPEWGRDQFGPHVFFSSYSDSSFTNTKISRVDINPVSGLWSMSAVNYPLGNVFPYASLDASYGSAFITFRQVSFGANVHEPNLLGHAFSDSSKPNQISSVSREIRNGGRFVSQPAGPVIMYTAFELVGSTVLNRPAFHDVIWGIYSQDLISDTKTRLLFYAFRAPELLPGAKQQLDDVVVVSTTPRGDATGGVDLEVFKMDRLTRKLVLWTKIVSPSKKYVKIISPEAFIFEGRSYLSMEVMSKSEAEGIVVIASVDPSLTGSDKILRVVSPVSTGVKRKDPETLMIEPSATLQKVIVYYHEIIGPDLKDIKCDTGLSAIVATGQN